MKRVCVMMLLLTAFNAFAAKGKDGNDTIAANAVINYYDIVTNIQNGPDVIVTVNNINNLNDTQGLYTDVALSAGDKVMLYQAQGADFSVANDSSPAYGAFNLNSAGRYEIHEVLSVSGNDITLAEFGTLCTADQLIYSFDAAATQIIRIPQFNDLTINATVSAAAWNGSTGGVVAIDVAGTLTLNGQIDASGLGFRGGVLDNSTSPGGENRPEYFYADEENGAEKGESILGFQVEYDAYGGRYGRGAPANGGGGGNGHNAGGGGGANGGNIANWNGQGNPDLSDNTWIAAWDIDGTLTSATTSSGGGRGGYTWGNSNQNALTTPPGDTSWTGDNRKELGGLGGRPLPFDVQGRIFFGGGGGAGDANNSGGGAGGNGGGIAIVIADVVTGGGSINVDGNQGQDAPDQTSNDAPGGAGGGGTLLLESNNLSGISLTANGGRGGNHLNSNTNENEGPGGGGGGGVIAFSGGAVSTAVNGGANGLSFSPAVTEFTPNGATIGGAGQSETISVDLPICEGVRSLNTVKTLTNNADEDGSSTVTEGDTLTYTITVTNTGEFPLTNVVVTDNLITPTGGSTPCATVPVAGTCTLIGTYTVTAGDVTTGSITNTGSGDSDETGQVDDVVVTPVAGSPGLTTSKALTNNADGDASGTVTEGDVLTYTVTVTNTGNIPLTNVVVTDNIITPSSITCPTVALGATCVLVGTYTVTAGDVTTGSITNTGSGDSDETGQVDDVVVTPVTGSPGLTTSKALTNNADGDASGTLTEGDVLTYTVTVTNTGNIPLTNVVVTDNIITPSSITCPTVAVGATCVLVGTYTVTAGDVTTGSITNTGSGDSDETGQVDDVVVTPVVGTPDLSVNKALTNNADEDGSTTITEGDTLTYTITATNSGNIPLTNVVVTDNLITPTGGSTPCATVPVAGTCTLIGTYTVTAGDVTTGTITNTGSADSDETGQVDDVLVTPIVGSPALTTSKALTNNADGDASGTVTEGDVLTYTVTVTNTGNIPLTNVVVTDNIITPSSITCPTVAVGATCVLVGTYTVTAGDVTTGSITNTGSGDSDETGQVDDVVVTPVVGTPDLSVNKALTNNADNDSSGTITEGDVLTYTITATNSGNTPLTNVVVTDNLITPTGGSTPCATVPVAGTCTLIGTYTVTAGDVTTGTITNTGSADSDETGQVDDVLVTPIVGSPALNIIKELSSNDDEDGSGTITLNDTLNFSIIATNTGNITLNNVVVSDPMITPSSTTCVTLAVGAQCQLLGTYVVQQSDVNNGEINNTGTVDSDETDPEVDVVIITVGNDPNLSIDKSLTSNADEDGNGFVSLGDTVTFTIIATNTGNVTLNNVLVEDDMITPGNITCASVDIGETCTLVGTYVIQQSDVDNGQLINIATAGSDETGQRSDTTDLTISVGIPPRPVSVPSTSLWGQLLMLLLMAALGSFMLRRHKA